MRYCRLGSTIATLSLGSKSVLRIRLKRHIYQNSSLLKVITGAYNWRNLQKVKNSVQAGMSVEAAWAQQNPYSGPASAPELVIPLIHGSVVVFQGKQFSKYFEASLSHKAINLIVSASRLIPYSTRSKMRTTTQEVCDSL
jgi:hypothetical protein